MSDLAKIYKETGRAKYDKPRRSGQFFGFVLVGVIAGTVNLLSRLFLSSFLSFEAAVALAYLIALTIAFILNRTMVFDSSHSNLAAQYAKFALVNLAALVQVWVVSIGLVRFVFPAVNFEWHSEMIGHTVGVASPLLTSFFFYKYWIFSDRFIAKPDGR